jgi:hypothetical protein
MSTALELGIGVAVAIGGTMLHDVVEFGRPVIENSGVVAVVLVAGAWAWSSLPKHRRIVRGSLLALAWLFFLGGAVASVLPLPIWPFEPDQNAGHYLVHALWAGALVVLLWTVRRLPT